MKVVFSGKTRPVSETLRETAAELPADAVTLSELLARVGEQGLLAMAILACLPFLLPISIPGTSGPFGLLIVLVGIGIAANAVPWLPRFLLHRRLPTRYVEPVMRRGADLFARLERMLRPRLTWLVDGRIAGIVNGAALALAGVLLALPIPMIGTNSPPAWAALLLAAGLLERDGAVLIAGHVVCALSLAFFAGLAIAALFFGLEVGEWLGWHSPG